MLILIRQIHFKAHLSLGLPFIIITLRSLITEEPANIKWSLIVFWFHLKFQSLRLFAQFLFEEKYSQSQVKVFLLKCLYFRCTVSDGDGRDWGGSSTGELWAGQGWHGVCSHPDHLGLETFHLTYNLIMLVLYVEEAKGYCYFWLIFSIVSLDKEI